MHTQCSFLVARYCGCPAAPLVRGEGNTPVSLCVCRCPCLHLCRGADTKKVNLVSSPWQRTAERKGRSDRLAALLRGDASSRRLALPGFAGGPLPELDHQLAAMLDAV